MEVNAIPGVPAAPTATAKTTEVPASLPAACRSFEAYFTSCLLGAMTKTLDLGKQGGVEGQSEQWAWTLLTQNVADQMAQSGSLGLSRQLEAYVQEKAGPEAENPDRPGPAGVSGPESVKPQSVGALK
jgi:Rod binding domain-containing protein